MTRARILADYVSSGDELALKAPLASPAFTGTPTGITAAHITSGVLPVGVTGGSGLDAVVAGKVLQVITNSASDQYSGSGFDFSDQSMANPSGTIQLASASNKVLIFFHLGNFGPQADYMYFDFGRTYTGAGGLGTSTNISGEIQGLGRAGTASAEDQQGTLHYTDAPGVADTDIVYKLHFRSDNDSTTVYAGADVRKSTITLMEIAV